MPKWMKALLGLSFVLFLIWLAAQWWKRPPKAQALVLPEPVVKFEIQKSSTTLVLEKTGESWQIKEPTYAADPEAVSGVLTALKGIVLGESLTNRVESHGTYEVTEANGVVVKVYGEKGNSVALVLGKMAKDFTHLYLRQAPRPEVYLVGGLRREDFEKTPQQWRNAKILNLAPGEEISRLQITEGKKFLDLVKSSDSWTVNQSTGNGQKIDFLALQFKDLKATDFVDPPASLDLKSWGLMPASGKVVVSTNKNNGFELQLGKTEPNRRLMRLVGSDTLYWVSSYSLESLPKTAQDLTLTNQ